MPRYDFDSYLLYEIKKRNVYSAKIKVILNEKVNGAVLRSAAEKAFRRFPYYSKTVALDKDGGYILEPCDKPLCVIEGDRSVLLGSEETNGLLFAINYEDSSVFFNISHNFCGGCGTMRWIKATLWQYLTDLGYEIDKTGIMTTDTPITDDEQAIPDPDFLPVGEPVGKLDFAMDSFVPMNDYIESMRDPEPLKGYYPIDIPRKELMKYARDNDGSPNSILSALLFKMCVKALPEQSKFTAGIANNYRADAGCPETYRDILRQMYVQYNTGMKDWSIDKLSTVTRSRMYIQMQPEYSWDQYRKMLEFRDQIDARPSIEEKVDFAGENSPTIHGVPSAFHISYVGKVDWGGLGPFIKGIYSLTQAHLMIEVNATDENFCISFHTIRKDGKYIREFLQVLDEEGFAYTAGELTDRKLPDTVLPPF